ncbi:MAG: hypothetical protein MUC95_10820 [Spirochaetes bacterium]|jgi:type II secretion system protein C|nr:hypothetical protein [Spirochaetota bacterium]
MQDIKYHITNIFAVVLFSYTFAVTVNQFFKFGMNPTDIGPVEAKRKAAPEIKRTSYDDYKKVILDESPFFEIASPADMAAKNGQQVVAGMLTDFTLLGTLSGSASIAKALIQKKSEKSPEIFKLWSEVYGYKLVRIDSFKVYLKTGDRIETLEMYADEQKLQAGKPAQAAKAVNAGDVVKNTQTISRAEIQQKVFNNMDNALKGIRAGPYRVNGNIEGYKLFRVQPDNILYQLGARSGDIVKRVNGHPVDSTEKLLKMWQNIQGEGKITIDIERGGKLNTFDFNISD